MTTTQAAPVDGVDVGELEQYRRELTGYCYRMLGSAFEADDAVQDTMVRAWRNLQRFEGRSSLRSWLYRIATNVCLDMLSGRKRRALPTDFGSSRTNDDPIGGALPEASWITPVADGDVLPDSADPAELAVARETVRLAFIAAIQHLPPRQRAVLILREVLRWSAAEVAELLDTSVASVNSSLQRARATLAATDLSGDSPVADGEQELLDRYVRAFEAYDMASLTALLHEDATQSMPPFEMWITGRENVLAWWTGQGIGCRGSRLLPVSANGSPAFAQYRPSGPNGEHEPWAIQVLEIADGQITGFTTFLDVESLFPMFGLPARLDD